MILLTVTTVLLAAVSANQNYNYAGYKVCRLQLTGELQLEVLDSMRNNRNLDFWSPIRRDAHPVDVMVNPEELNWFFKTLKEHSIKHEVLIEDVEKSLSEERMRQLFVPRIAKGDITFTAYHRHDEINAYLDKLAKNHPELVTLETIGKSYEGRDLNLIKISSNKSAAKPIIFMDAGIHAREWIAPPVALYTINQLVENEENLSLLDNVDWHILPVANPDGYEYSHTNNRFWRKTRSPGKSCVGVDANRNFDFHWAEIGSSNNQCSETYHGPNSFSESEARAVRDHILLHKDRVKLYLTIHSYGNLILYPWGFTYDLPENHEELHALGKSVSESIRGVSGTSYTVGSVTHVLVPGAGGSDDWAKGGAGVEFSYTIELPGGGTQGFDPPSSRILPVVTETWEGLKTFNEYIAKKFRK